MEARVGTLHNELAVQQQKIEAQRQHYDESVRKMEVSYRLLQQRVEQDMQEIRAEMAKNVEQQMQSLRPTLQKGIAELVTA